MEQASSAPRKFLVEGLLEKASRPLVDEITFFIDAQFNESAPTAQRLNKYHPDIIRMDLSFTDSAHQSQDQMLAVGFQNKSVLALTKGGFDEDVTQLGLQRRMKMYFRLFHSDQLAL